MLRYRADRSSLGCVIVSATGQVAWLATGKVAFLLPMFAALRWTALVQHNQSHLTMFRHRWANRLLELTVGTVTGTPMELYREGHARTHHPHVGTSKDWTQPTQLRDGQALQCQPLSRWRYLYVFAPRGWFVGCSAVRRVRSHMRCLIAEGAAMAVFAALPVLLGAPVRLLPIILQWTVVAVFSAHANYEHHNGYLRADRPTDFANDTSSRLHTSLGFNIGYHTAHHRRPNAHWTKLPDLEANRAPQRATAGVGPANVARTRQQPS